MAIPKRKSATSQRLRLLVLNFFPAYNPPSSGGEARVFHYYSELSKVFDISLISSHGIEEPDEIIEHNEHFTEYRCGKPGGYHQKWADVDAPKTGLEISAVVMAKAAGLPQSFISQYLEQHAWADIIVHEFPHTIDYDLFRGLDDKFRIFSSHNDEVTLARDLYEGTPLAELEDYVAEKQSDTIAHAQLVYACSNEDRKSFMKEYGLPAKSVEVVPNGMVGLPPSDPALRDGKTVLFMGSGHKPNVTAANYIVTELAPSLPEYEFVIIGSCMAARTQGNVRCLGLVSAEEKDRLLNECAVFINPMTSGSGTNVKMLDALMHGAPILSTPHGARGIDGVDGTHFVLSEIETFGPRLKTMLADAGGLEKLAGSAYEIAAKDFDWERIADKSAKLISKHYKAFEKALKSREKLPPILMLNDYDFSGDPGGGATRLTRIYSQVSTKRKVAGVCFSNSEEIERHEFSEDFILIKIPKTEEHARLVQEENEQFYISVNDIVAARECARNKTLIGTALALSKFTSTTIASHPYMTDIATKLPRPIIYESHNNEVLLKKSMLEWHPHRDRLLPIVERIENTLLLSAMAVTACSREDLKTLSERVKTMPSTYFSPNAALPPAVDPETKFETEPNKRLQCVFIGSGHIPNIEAAERVIKEIAPDAPDVDFHIVGSVCESLSEKMPTNVTLHGKLSETQKSKLFLACDIGLNPMLSGSGSNLKVADYFAHGLTVMSTHVGARGYSAKASALMLLHPIEAFGSSLQKLAPAIIREETRVRECLAIHHDEMSWSKSASAILDAIDEIETVGTRKRLLFTTYRYMDEPPGGGERHLLDILDYFQKTGRYDIDVVSPDLNHIEDFDWIRTKFEKTEPLARPADKHNLHWRVFPLDKALDEIGIGLALDRAREVEGGFWRHAISAALSLEEPAISGISSSFLWGWSYTTSRNNKLCRQILGNAGIFVRECGELKITGLTETSAVLKLTDWDGKLLSEHPVDGDFSIEIEISEPFLVLAIEAADGEEPLVFVEKIKYGKAETIDLDSQPADFVRTIAEDDIIETFYTASTATRVKHETSLTAIRGPFSAQFDDWLTDNIAEYDAVITHNSVLSPAVKTIAAAKEASVPSIVIPHPHFDDSYYHFADHYESIRDASAALLTPQKAVDFSIEHLNPNSHLLNPGLSDFDEFSEKDAIEFEALYPEFDNYLLVLGRKAGSKNYRSIIRAFQALKASHAAETKSLKLLLVGPDEDQLPVTEKDVHYLGPLDRSVMRGALMRARALVNMSMSESFGMVIIEAWRANTLVVANSECQAFRSVATDGKNAILCSEDTLASVLVDVALDKKDHSEMITNGRKEVEKYRNDAICAEIEKLVLELIQKDTRLSTKSMTKTV